MLRKPVLLLVLILTGCAVAVAEWHTATPLPAPRWYPGCCAYDGYVYATGGEQSGVGQRNVWYAQVQEDGTLSSWSSTTNLPGGRMYHGCVAYEGYLYVLGGWGYGYHNTVWYAEIHTDGSIGSWFSTTPMPAARDGIGCVVHDGYLYVVGGYDGGSDYTTVWFAPIEGDGSVGAWNSTTSMPAVRRCHGGCAHDGHLYITGGFTMGALPDAHNDVWCAQVQPDGFIGPWVSTSALPSARYGHPCCAHDGRLLVTGGQTAFSYYSTVWHGDIGADGLVDLWETADALPESRTGHGACVDGVYLYVIGGVNWSGNLDTVRYTDLRAPEDVAIDVLGPREGFVRLSVTPNVVANQARIGYQIASTPGESRIPVSLNLYDASGRLVRVLVDAERAAGSYHADWVACRSGMYLLELSTPFGTDTKKIVAVR
jgi:N-acetylneuraminic acid mutarotase